MHSPDRLRRPFGALLAGEVRNVGLAVLREAALAALALALVCLLMGMTAIRYHEPLTLAPELLLPALPAAMILPWLVWRGDPPFGRALLWTFPVHRQRAAVARIAAGAAWLVLAQLVAFAMLATTTLATGGGLGLSEVRYVGDASAGLAAAARVPWFTPLWMWVVPFGGALLLYLLGSAVLLGLRHPVRWVAAIALAVTLTAVLSENLGPDNPLNHGLSQLEVFVEGRWGLDFALTGGVASLSREVDVPGPGSATFWSALPTAGRWASALLVWFGAALLALALALRRHWER